MNVMSDTPRPPPKSEPESLSLRAAPRRVVRFKRNLLIGIAAIASAAIFAATWLALGSGQSGKPQTGDELYNTERKPKSDGLSALPSNYDKIRLGAPLPGDLGPPVVARENSLGISPTDANFKPNPEDDAARAERMRRAQQAQQASESGVLFQIANKDTGENIASQHSTPTDVTPSSVTSQQIDNGQLKLDLANDQNGQARKLDFISQKDETGIYNPHALQQPISPYEILAGSVISASLITGINSDLPGFVVAQVTEDLYDSKTGTILLIPQGSRILGAVDSVVAFGQKRALVVWQRIIMPNGSSVQIDNLPAMDAAGYSGLEDEVDYHTWTLLEGIALSTLLGIGGQVAFGSNQSNLVEAIRESTQESTNQAGQHIVEKDLNVQPTLKIRPGWPLKIIVSKDIVLAPYRS
jgi:type IV secretory pathway VirB10-like protein